MPDRPHGSKVLFDSKNPTNFIFPASNSHFFCLVCISLAGLALTGFLGYKMLNILTEQVGLDKSEAKRRQKLIFQKLKIPNLDLDKYEIAISSEIVIPQEIDISFEDVAGLESEISELKSLLINSLAPSPHDENSLKSMKRGFSHSLFDAPKGVLLYGPPGCGKTMLAKCVAKSCNLRFINVDLSLIMDKYFGETEKYIKALFSLAAKIQPYIIFIDEIESLLRCRSVESSYEGMANLKSQILSHWDGMLEMMSSSTKTNSNSKQTPQVVVMGATNRPHDIDMAFLRRFSLKISIPLPNEQARRAILAKYIEQAPEFIQFIQSSSLLDTLAECTEGYTGSSLKDLVKFTFIQAKEQHSQTNQTVFLDTDSFWTNIERFSQWSNIY